jgi:membrane protein
MANRAPSFPARLNVWIQRHRWTRVGKRATLGFLGHDGLQYAGSMAYFAVLSLFQLLVLGVVIGSFFLGEGEARDFVVEQVAAATPLDAETIGGIIDTAIESRGTLTILSLGFLLWGALGIFSAISGGIGRVFEATAPRPFVLDKLVGLLLMALTGLMAGASLIIGIVTGILQQVAADVTGTEESGGFLVWVIGLVAPMILIFFAFWVIYRVVPNRPVTWREVLPGALVAAALWTVLRFGFTWYATSVADYESTFGPFATAITLLVFLYFAGVIVLLGAEVARANALDDEMGVIAEADPRFLPVPVDLPPAPAGPQRRRGVSVLALAAAAVIGLVLGRLSKRDDV